MLHSRERNLVPLSKEKFGAAEQREIWCCTVLVQEKEERVGVNQKRQLPVVQSSVQSLRS